MLGTLFFDESCFNTAFRARARQEVVSSLEAGATGLGLRGTEAADLLSHDSVTCLHDGGGLLPAHSCAFACRGEVALPSIQAALLWWLDADASVVRLLAVNNTASSEAARSCQSRLLTVELTIKAPRDLVTCGVTGSYMGDNEVSVIWVQRSLSGEPQEEVLCPAFARVTVQREVDNTGHSSLLLFPDDRVVQCCPLSRVPRSFFHGVLADSGNAACVIAALPDDASPSTIAIVVLTDGARVWRAELLADGTTTVSGFRDEHRRNVLRSLCDGNEEVRLLDTRSVVADLQRLEDSTSSGPPLSADPGAVGSGGSHRGSAWIRWILGGPTLSGATPSSGNDSGAAGVLDAALPASVRQRLYVAVTAVQQSSLVVLTRWNGQLEVYDTAGSALKLAQDYPVGILPQSILRPVGCNASGHGAQLASGKGGWYALPPGRVVQWATRSPSTQLLHIVSCCSSGEGRTCLWSALPPLTSHSGAIGFQRTSDTGEVLAQHCTLSMTPPTQSSFPLACAVTADGHRMILVSDVGSEEDGHLLCTRSLGALTLRGDHQGYGDGAVTVMLVMEAVDGVGLGDLLRTSRVKGYLCQGARMQSVVAQDNAVLTVERGSKTCRLYSLEDAARDSMRQANEVVVVGVDDEDVYTMGSGIAGDGVAAACVGGGFLSSHRVHYVPLSETSHKLVDTAVQSAVHGMGEFSLYWEGVNLVQACPYGSQLMSDFLEDVLLAAVPIPQLASLPRFLSEAHLSGYSTALQRGSAAMKAAARAAIRMALSHPSAAATGERRPALYRFSRLYVTHATLSEILSRITFLVTSYLGWQSACSAAQGLSSSAEDDTESCSSDWVSHQLVAALEVLVAAYHAVPAAGADLIQLAFVDGSVYEPSCETLVTALLPTLANTGVSNNSEDASGGDGELSALSMVRVANRFLHCGTPSTARACTLWAKKLSHRFPLLQHYELLSLLGTAGASAQSERVLGLCERVCLALAKESPAVATTALLMEGLLLTDISGPGSGFLQVSLEEVAAFLATDSTLGPKLYAVGVLRRTTAVGSLHTSLSHTIIQRYLYTTLAVCMEGIERMQRCASTTVSAPTVVPFAQLRRAMEDLQVDVLLASALARGSDGDVAGCFHDLQTALDFMARHKYPSSYAEMVQVILGHIVEGACSSQAKMNALLRVTTFGAAQLEDSLILLWYNYIARLPTKSATEATEAIRYRAIMGLHRHLMSRHCYAQCARLMSSLATLIRCSPLRRNTWSRISVSEIAGLALHAAEMIAPSAPIPESVTGGVGETSQTSPNMFSHNPALIAGSPLSLGYSWQSITSAYPAALDCDAGALGAPARSPRWLTRADIPWLRRRLYQAYCERQLWRRGCTLDCTDLWVEGAPAEAYHLGVEKLVVALMQTRLWPQAFRFACLSAAFDPCTVLIEWAADLLRAPREYGTEDVAEAEAADADRTAAWEELIGYCGELSNLENQFYAYVRTVTAALMCTFSLVPTALLEAHRAADAYTAMTTLFHVAFMLRKQVELAEVEAKYDEEDTNELSSSSSSVSAAGVTAGNGTVLQRAISVKEMRCNVWRAWCAAAEIGIDILTESRSRHTPASLFQRGARTVISSAGVTMATAAPHMMTGVLLERNSFPASSNARTLYSAFTAGTLDPMAAFASELLGISAYRASLDSVEKGEATVRQFQDIMGRP